MGTLVVLFLLLAVPLILQLKGWNVSAQLFALALIAGASLLLWPFWGEMDWVKAGNAALRQELIGFDPCLYVADRGMCGPPPTSFRDPVELWFVVGILAGVAAINWLQERLNPNFFRRTKRAVFWAITVFIIYSGFDGRAHSLGEVAFWAYVDSPEARSEALTRLGEELMNSTPGELGRDDAETLLFVFIVFLSFAIISISSIAGILIHFLRRSDSRS